MAREIVTGHQPRQGRHARGVRQPAELRVEIDGAQQPVPRVAARIDEEGVGGRDERHPRTPRPLRRAAVRAPRGDHHRQPLPPRLPRERLDEGEAGIAGRVRRSRAAAGPAADAARNERPEPLAILEERAPQREDRGEAGPADVDRAARRRPRAIARLRLAGDAARDVVLRQDPAQPPVPARAGREKDRALGRFSLDEDVRAEDRLETAVARYLPEADGDVECVDVGQGDRRHAALRRGRADGVHRVDATEERIVGVRR